MNWSFLKKKEYGVNYEKNGSSRIFQRKPGLPWQTLEGATLIIAPRDQESHELTGVGSFIWESLDGKKDMALVAGEIREAWDCGAADVEEETAEFFQSLLEKKLVEEVVEN